MKFRSKIWVLLLSFTPLFTCCENTDKEYKYYSNGKLKSIRELKDGKANGVSLLYDSGGNKIKSLKTKDGKLHGVSTEYYADGTISSEIQFVNGLMQGNYNFFYSSGKLKQSGFFDNGEISLQTKEYDSLGRLLPMVPDFYLNSDVLSLGDTLKVRATMYNVNDLRYMNGTLVLGSKFVKDEIVSDTIVMSHSGLNDYTLRYVPQSKGKNKFILELIFREEENEVKKPLEVFFGEITIFVK